MKYDIVYACGHAGVIQVYGKSADRDRKIKWMETNCLCPNCQANENKKRTEIAIKETAGLNLPTLTGSQKQIDWAVVIRAKRIEEAKIFLATNLPPEVREKARKFYACIQDRLRLTGGSTIGTNTQRRPADWNGSPGNKTKKKG